MLNLKSFVEKNVNVICTDVAVYNNYYVDCFTDAYDNYEPNEDSIDIFDNSKRSAGIVLYRSENKSIETAQ